MRHELDRQAHRGNVILAIAVVAGLVGLAGCSATGEPDKTVPAWVEPGWMAQVRQQNEEHNNAMIVCFAEYGIGVVAGIGAPGVVFLSPTGDDGQLPPGFEDVLRAAADDCNARIPLPDHADVHVFDDAAYERMLDTRACLIAHGYDVPEPPSLETWKDSDLMTGWNPYIVTFSGAVGAQITDDEMRSLNEDCPQSGPNFWVTTPSDEGA